MRPKVRAALEAAQKPKPTTDATAADDRAPPPDDDAAPIVASSSPAPAPASDADADADAPRASLPFFGDQCAICQEDVSRRGRLDSCAHVFCVACIKRWAKIETRCPLCKARFSFIQPEDVDVDVDVAGEDGTSTDAKTKTKTTTTTRGGSRGGAKKPNKPLKRIYLPRRDQTYEDPDGGELPDGVDVETVLCGRCGDGGDEDKLMLCDGCDQGYHCYCVGLDEVPYDAWRCLICANDDSDSADVDAVDQSDADAALARGLQRAEDDDAEAAASAAAFAAARARAARLRAASSARNVNRRGGRGGRGVGGVGVGVGGGIRSTPAATDDRSRQIARVTELRELWERYRSGELGFSSGRDDPRGGGGGGGRGEPPTTRTAGTADRAAGAVEDRPDLDPAAVANQTNRPYDRFAFQPGEEEALGDAVHDAWDAMKRAEAEGLKSNHPSVGPKARARGGGGDDARARAVAVLTREREAAAAAGSGSAHVRRRRPAVPARRRLPTPPPGPGGGGLSVRLIAGVSFSPPRPGRAKTRTHPTRPREKKKKKRVRSEWSESDASSESEPAGPRAPWEFVCEEDDDDDLLAAFAAKKKNGAAFAADPPRAPTELDVVREIGRGHLRPATGFVPPGAVSHCPTLSDSRRRAAASLEAREAARVASIETGAPSKHEIARRVKEKLKPAWNARTLSREQFKERAERATKAASAAAAATALRLVRERKQNEEKRVGAEEGSVDGRREAYVATFDAAIEKAIDAALLRASTSSGSVAVED